MIHTMTRLSVSSHQCFLVRRLPHARCIFFKKNHTEGIIKAYGWVQYGNCRPQTLNPEKNIWFLHAPSIWFKISQGDLSKSGESKYQVTTLLLQKLKFLLSIIFFCKNTLRHQLRHQSCSIFLNF